MALTANPTEVIRSGANPSGDELQEMTGITQMPDIQLGEPSYGPLVSDNGTVRTYALPDQPMLEPGYAMSLSGGVENAGLFVDARASMRDYWGNAQDDAAAEGSFLKYAGAGVMRWLGDVGYSGAETGAAVYNDPNGALAGAGKALVNFGPEAFNAASNLTKTSLNGLTLLAESAGSPAGTFAGFRASDPYNIDLLTPYSNQAESGGALLTNLAVGTGVAKYGNVALQSPVYLDLQLRAQGIRLEGRHEPICHPVRRTLYTDQDLTRLIE